MDDEELSKLITASALAGAAEAQARDDQLEQERREREQRERDERDRQAQREREAVDRAAAKRRRRTEATAGSIAKLWLGVPYLIVVFGSFLMSLPDEPTLTSGMFLGLLKTVAIAVIAAAVVCWLSDYVLGRPRRWILA
ncbi:hypothetical protein, partial [Gordonia crocea]|uniref:hypothetical protein n=1 Tax=Gordonia crocea TaxID=589162 RepID=UPI00353174CF